MNTMKDFIIPLNDGHFTYTGPKRDILHVPNGGSLTVEAGDKIALSQGHYCRYASDITVKINGKSIWGYKLSNMTDLSLSEEYINGVYYGNDIDFCRHIFDLIMTGKRQSKWERDKKIISLIAQDLPEADLICYKYQSNGFYPEERYEYNNGTYSDGCHSFNAERLAWSMYRNCIYLSDKELVTNMERSTFMKQEHWGKYYNQTFQAF